MPPGVVTVTVPEVGPDVGCGTVTVSNAAEVIVYDAEVPKNFTLVAPLKFVPVMVIVSYGKPDVSESPVIAGVAGINLKSDR